jgi:hypothetical protein
VAEKGRLGQDLEVQERRGRLKGDRPELLSAMEQNRRIDIQDRNGKDQSSGQAAHPPEDFLSGRGRPPANGMIAEIDGLHERLEVLG